MHTFNRFTLSGPRQIFAIVLPLMLAGVLLVACDAATLIDSDAPETSLTAAAQLEEAANNHTVNQQGGGGRFIGLRLQKRRGTFR